MVNFLILIVPDPVGGVDALTAEFLVDHAEVVLHVAELGQAAVEHREGPTADLPVGEEGLAIVHDRVGWDVIGYSFSVKPVSETRYNSESPEH